MTPRQVKTFKVGLEPSALLAVGKNLVVTNTDDDSVTTIDTVKQQVGRTFAADPAPGAPYGAQPNGLAMLDATHLAVSLGRDNAVAVYQYKDAYKQPAFEGLIPTGMFPTGLAEDDRLNQLVVASEQGVGSVGPNGTVNQGTGTNPATSHLGYNFVGTVQAVAPPTARQMQTYTRQVFKNNQWNGLQRNRTGSGKAVPLHVGDPSKIKHVFLIVKENRTYDQVLGDNPRGNGRCEPGPVRQADHPERPHAGRHVPADRQPVLGRNQLRRGPPLAEPGVRQQLPAADVRQLRPVVPDR